MLSIKHTSQFTQILQREGQDVKYIKCVHISVYILLNIQTKTVTEVKKNMTHHLNYLSCCN